MKPKACINCGKTIWIEVIDPKRDNRSQLEKSFDGYCGDCKVSAQRTSNDITKRRSEQRVTEQLDLDEVSKLREWL
jgi:hypothetical protein